MKSHTPLLSLALLGCQTLEVEHLEVREAAYDDAARATRVTLDFDVTDGELPVQSLEAGDVRVYEDGVAASTESFGSLSAERRPVPVAVLLDTSASVYQSGHEDFLRSAAGEFVDALRDQGFDVAVYRFARTVEQIDEVGVIDASAAELPADQRWTSLYHAVLTVMQERPGSTLVVVSDGADSYSHNLGVAGIEAVEQAIEAGGRSVHTIGFGNVADEVDRQGVTGNKALRRLAARGTHRNASSEADFIDLYDYLMRRTRTRYSYEYFSPYLDGAHAVEVELRSGRAQGRSEPVTVDR